MSGYYLNSHAEMLAWLDRPKGQKETNPCERLKVIDHDTLSITFKACDSKRCPDCGPLKLARLWESTQQVFSGVAYIARIGNLDQFNHSLAAEKKARLRRGAESLDYQVIGDLVLSTEPFLPEQKRRALDEWRDRIEAAYRDSRRRIRRSKAFLAVHIPRLSLLPIGKKGECGTCGGDQGRKRAHMRDCPRYGRYTVKLVGFVVDVVEQVRRERLADRRVLRAAIVARLASGA